MKDERYKEHPNFKEAVEFVKNKETISGSELMAHFNLGYNTGGMLVDQLEDAGIIGAFEGSKQRKVLINQPTSK